MALFVRRLGRYMKRTSFFKGSSLKRFSSKSRGRHSLRKCYECDDRGHFIADCPNAKYDKKKDKKCMNKHGKHEGKGQAHIGEDWDSDDSGSSSSDNEVIATSAIELSTPTSPRLLNYYSSNDEAPMCLMEKEPKVSPPLKLLNVDLTSDCEGGDENEICGDYLLDALATQNEKHMGLLHNGLLKCHMGSKALKKYLGIKGTTSNMKDLAMFSHPKKGWMQM
ncbi:hypothetical protein E2562_012873 [Oryza meyeriana var. granulata]|uniref:CCHC-type domain-containing protein n=1 Tax=Oryza meyeriana var. granulata TaxID=110450 RepID=A0A6G1CR02_9ORYZ|nr:hypothetical protein E2562_012873 [Oryza meyeriana var. granulata]